MGSQRKSKSCGTQSCSAISLRRRNPLTVNRLTIEIPGVGPTIGEVLLNGKPLRHLLSLRIEIPGKGKCNTFVTVTARFLSSVRFHGDMRTIKTSRNNLELSS